MALSEQGHKVILVERRNHLGGRAYSFIDPKTGDVVDNGQHLFMGCYHNTISFLKQIGCLDRLKIQESPRVEFLDVDTGRATFRCPPLPAPLHALAGLFGLGGLSLGDKFRTLKVGRALKTTNQVASGLTVSEWLSDLGQSERIKRRFWYPIAIATLNEDPNIGSAEMLRVVLKEAFGGDRSGTSIAISRVGLSDLYTVGAREFIESRGGDVRTGAPAAQIVIENGRVVGVRLKSGETIHADVVISAVPPNALLDLLPEQLRVGEFARLSSLGSSPIVSINLWFDRRVTDLEFIGLLGTKIQWLFNKDVIFASERQSNQVAIVISAAREFVDQTKEDLVTMALSELQRLVPDSRAARLVHSVVVKEREATLAHTVESDGLRPAARTGVAGLILAGDWTATGLPATIESAVISGRTAAGMVDAAGPDTPLRG